MHRQSRETADATLYAPRKRQRKQRPCYSCEECRRLKMKCDREVPCSNCVRRHRVELCAGAEPVDLPSNAELDLSTQESRDAQGITQTDPSISHTQRLSAAQQACTATRSEDTFTGRPLTAGGLSSYNSQDPASPKPASVQPHSTDDPATRTRASFASNGGTSTIATSLQPPHDNCGNVGSHGTLMISRGGLSKYLGPTAGSEWLKESEAQDVHDSPTVTRAPSPEKAQLPNLLTPYSQNHDVSGSTFPFSASPAGVSTRQLLACLPPKEEAWTLVECYFRYCAWHHNVAPRAEFEDTFNRVYAYKDGGSQLPRINAQDIALVYIIMAQGTMFNIEMPVCDSSAEEWLELAERCLVKGDFLSSNTISGLQTLHLMAHLHLQMDKGRRGDRAWPLWGLVMRLIQAMGIHRDGSRWDLPPDVVEQRRKVFWECNAADTFQAHCFSRPCALNPEHCDTAFPTDSFSENGVKSYSLLRFELSQLSGEILNAAMKVQKPPYSQVLVLGNRLLDYERDVPFHLRCRAAFLSMPSRYPEIHDAIKASPEPSRRSMAISFQQTNLALNISETIVNLHRPYYAKTIYETPIPNGMSMHAVSFMSVVERCAIIIAIVKDIHARFPTVSTRQWNFWYHVFGSALCLGTLILRDPRSDMATLVITQIDVAIELFRSLIQHGANTPRYQRNVEWLIKLRARAVTKVAAVSSQKSTDPADGDRTTQRGHNEDIGDDEHEEFLGLQTRLIERAGHNHHIRTTIGSQNTVPLPVSQQNATGTTPAQSEATVTSTTFAEGTGDSVGELLHDFWDPLLLQSLLDAPIGETESSFNRGFAWWEDTAHGASAE